MPDATKKTVSASQVAALYDKSPYLTKWMLFQQFASGVNVEQEMNERMEIGTLLEDDILELARRRLRLDITPNREYVRHATLPLGCTTDASIIDPSLGAGVVEAKSVDWLTWKETWTEEFAPPHIELQLQAQMLVLGSAWGLIPALVGGNELRLYRRLPNQEAFASISAEAVAFMKDVKEGNAPDPLGLPRELPWLKAMYPETKVGKIVEAPATADDLVAEYQEGTENGALYDKQREAAKIKLLALAGEAEILNTPKHSVYVKRDKRGAIRLTVKEH